MAWDQIQEVQRRHVFGDRTSLDDGAVLETGSDNSVNTSSINSIIYSSIIHQLTCQSSLNLCVGLQSLIQKSIYISRYFVILYSACRRTHRGGQGDDVHVHVSFSRRPGDQQPTHRVRPARLRNQVEVPDCAGNCRGESEISTTPLEKV